MLFFIHLYLYILSIEKNCNQNNILASAQAKCKLSYEEYQGGKIRKACHEANR